MEKEYKNITITGVWSTKNGHFSSMPLDARAFDLLTRSLEQGGRLFIRKRSEASMSKSKDPSKSPPYYLEFMPAEVVAEFEATRERSSSKHGL